MANEMKSKTYQAIAAILLGLTLFFCGICTETLYQTDPVIRSVRAFSKGYKLGYQKAEITISKGAHPTIKPQR